MSPPSTFAFHYPSSIPYQTHPTKTLNPIDACWRSDPKWSSNHRSLANCTQGFGQSAIGGKFGPIYTVTDPPDNPIDPKPGTPPPLPSSLTAVANSTPPVPLSSSASKNQQGLWSVSNYGSDMIIALLDIGIWPERRIFSYLNLDPVLASWKAVCETGPGFPASSCSKKIARAGIFLKNTAAAAFGGATISKIVELNSPRDTDGPGANTASTAAGRHVLRASMESYATKVAKVVAVKARITAHKVCLKGPRCLDSGILFQRVSNKVAFYVEGSRFCHVASTRFQNTTSLCHSNCSSLLHAHNLFDKILYTNHISYITMLDYNTTLSSQLSTLLCQRSDITEIKSTLRQFSQTLAEISSKLSSYPPPPQYVFATPLQSQPDSPIHPPSPTPFTSSLSKTQKPTSLNYGQVANNLVDNSLPSSPSTTATHHIIPSKTAFSDNSDNTHFASPLSKSDNPTNLNHDSDILSSPHIALIFTSKISFDNTSFIFTHNKYSLIFTMGSISDLEDKVDFEGMAMIRLIDDGCSSYSIMLHHLPANQVD